MEQNKLKVGDIIYGRNRMYGICRKVVVERLTRTQAICGGLKFKIEVYNGKIKLIGQTDVFNTTYYYLENDQLKEEYFRQNACAQLKSFDYGSLSTETLKQLMLILDQNLKL